MPMSAYSVATLRVKDFHLLKEFFPNLNGFGNTDLDLCSTALRAPCQVNITDQLHDITNIGI